MVPRASTSTSPLIASQYLLDDIDATSTLVGESVMTSPSLSSNETISLPDETNETNSTATPSTVGSPASSKKSRLHPQKREMNETRRRINLEEDWYTTDVRPKSVQCTECLREISLDKRWRYYDYPWRKHRRTCLMIRIAEAQRLKNEAIRNDAFFYETARSTPHAISPGEALKWIQVEGLGTVDTQRREKKRPRDSSEDPVPRTGRLTKHLNGCDD
ncbi:hypothetical protein PILCRDRAFT_822342 [Piloderma croceum F 1598]|uniref:BED-type domain-containing protein n=1 Tax=Piloderma croceum (strain F 1598) TaxID=765440 RepID=A0A0C3B343_PILCF|nr:hypothetical protein PILCRDRAFT_822342 [Piloderma croceum F 1598]